MSSGTSEPPPDTDAALRAVPDTVLYEMFHEAGRQIAEAYWATLDQDGQQDTDAVEGHIRAVRQQRRTVGPQDREQQITLIRQWDQERAGLTARP